jgi:hypothetical protein
LRCPSSPSTNLMYLHGKKWHKWSMDVHAFPRCIYATKTCIIWRIVKTSCKRVQASLKKRYATYMCRRCFIMNTWKWFFSPPFHP